jgi:hypothetical protein
VDAYQVRATIWTLPPTTRSFALDHGTPKSVAAIPSLNAMAVLNVTPYDHVIDVISIADHSMISSRRFPRAPGESNGGVFSLDGRSLLTGSNKKWVRIDVVDGVVLDTGSNSKVATSDAELRYLAFQRDDERDSLFIRGFNDSLNIAYDVLRWRTGWISYLWFKSDTLFYSLDGRHHFVVASDTTKRGAVTYNGPEPPRFGQFIVVKRYEPMLCSIVNVNTRDTVFTWQWAWGRPGDYFHALQDGSLLALLESKTLLHIDHKTNVPRLLGLGDTCYVNCINPLDSSFIILSSDSVIRVRYDGADLRRTAARATQDLFFDYPRVSYVARGSYMFSSYYAQWAKLLDSNLQWQSWFDDIIAPHPVESFSASPSGSWVIGVSTSTGVGDTYSIGTSSYMRPFDIATGRQLPPVSVRELRSDIAWLQEPDRPVFARHDSLIMIDLQRQRLRSLTHRPVELRSMQQLNGVGLFIDSARELILIKNDGAIVRVTVDGLTNARLDTCFVDQSTKDVYLVFTPHKEWMQLNGTTAMVVLVRLSYDTDTWSARIVEPYHLRKPSMVFGYDADRRCLHIARDVDRRWQIHTVNIDRLSTTDSIDIPPGIVPRSARWLQRSNVYVIGSSDVVGQGDQYTYDPVSSQWLMTSHRPVYGSVGNGSAVLTGSRKQDNDRPVLRCPVEIYDPMCQRQIETPEMTGLLANRTQLVDSERTIIGIDSALTIYPLFVGDPIPDTTLHTPWMYTSHTGVTDYVIDHFNNRSVACDCVLNDVSYYTLTGELLRQYHGRSHELDPVDPKGHHIVTGQPVFVLSTCLHGTRRSLLRLR